MTQVFEEEPTDLTIPAPVFSRAIERAFEKLPSEPVDGGECIEFEVNGQKRYLFRGAIPLFEAELTEQLGSPALGQVAARRAVALSCLLIKPHFVLRVAARYQIAATDALALLFSAAAQAPLRDVWSFDPGGFERTLLSLREGKPAA